MAVSATLCSLDDFLISPTFSTMPDMYLDDSTEIESVGMATHDEQMNLKVDRSDRKPAYQPGTIRNFSSLWTRGYNSEEEGSSPSDGDDVSCRSLDSEHDQIIPTIAEEPVLIERSESPLPDEIQQSYVEAQAVTVVAAGKAKMVSLPKLITVTPVSRPITRPKRPFNSPEVRPRPLISRINITREEDQVYVPRQRSDSPFSFQGDYSGTKTNFPDLDSPGNRRTVRHKASIPLFQAAASTPASSIQYSSPASEASALFPPYDYHRQDSLSSSSVTDSPTPSTPSVRKVSKFSSPFSHVFGKGGKRVRAESSASSENSSSPLLEQTGLGLSYAPAEISSLTRSATVKPKLVARGANEREPPIVLPPCPKSYDASNDFSTVTSWPSPRSGATSELGYRPTLTRPMPSTRSRSFSSALVFAEA